MKKNDYKLTITLDFKSVDHIDARLISQDILSVFDKKIVSDESLVLEDFVIKLQQVFDNKPPERVSL